MQKFWGVRNLEKGRGKLRAKAHSADYLPKPNLFLMGPLKCSSCQKQGRKLYKRNCHQIQD